MLKRDNSENPYFEGFCARGYIPVWHAIECAYCQAKLGEHCIVQYTRTTTRRMANEIHHVRRQTQRAAYDAWELGQKTGREQGQQDVLKAVQGTLDTYRHVATLLKAVQ